MNSFQFDTEQINIINATENRIIVVAGAGSGKTSVLTARIRHLILDLKVHPSEIIAITFTNMAAEEMQDRLSDVPDINTAFIGTIHSFANRIMRESGYFYNILTDEIHINLCREIINNYAKHLTIERFEKFMELASKVKTGKVTKKSLNEFFWSEEEEEYKDMYRQTPVSLPVSIPVLCKQRNIITFNELIKLAQDYMKKNNRVINYCFVDEFQDVGNLEDAFIMSLNAKHYFLVGDDWQSIYKFKGANVELFKSKIRSNDWTTYFMTRNYRNASSIIKSANMIINQTSDKIDKDIKATRKEQGTVMIKPKNMLSDYLKIIKTISNFGEWFFLARSNADCNKLAESCKKYDIPYCMFRQGDLTPEQLHEAMQSDVVKILTVHSSKGLENTNVMLYGNFPMNINNKSKNYYFKRVSSVNTDEERRIMYVGMTRAKNHLLILN